MEQTLNLSQPETLDFAGRIKTLTNLLKNPAAQVTVEGFASASRALFLAHLKKNVRRPIVLLTSDQNTGDALLGDLKYFFQYEKIKAKPQFFPTWETLPYEHISPLKEVSGERLSILDQLMHDGCPFLVVPVEAVMQCLVPKSVLAKQVFSLKKADSLERELLEASLTDNGYSRVHMVEDRGEYSVRGDIVDFFQSATANPIRVEFFGDQVESLREFDINSQVSVQEVAETKILPVCEVMLTPGTEVADEERRARAVLDALGGAHGAPAQAALRFSLAQPGIATVVIGLAEQGHLETALEAAMLGPLPEPAIAALAPVWAGNFGLG